jgi:hypothetical protein
MKIYQPYYLILAYCYSANKVLRLVFVVVNNFLLRLSTPNFILAYSYCANKVIRSGFVIANNFLLRSYASHNCDLCWAKEPTVGVTLKS